MRIGAEVVARVTSGRIVGSGHDASVEADGIWFDTRSLCDGQAFVAVVGDPNDGHDHLADAAARGAPWALVGRGRAHPSLVCIEVDDTLVALAEIARHCRTRLDATCGPRVIGITGSAGKTTTKDLVHAVLSRGFPGARASENSLNNDIGLPVTIANVADDCPALVLEMGMRGFGEIDRLCRVARPNIAVVTIVGDAHSERVGGVDGVARAKGEIVAALDESGTAVLNADDPRVAAMTAQNRGRTVTYGSVPGADVRWSVVSRDDLGRATVRFEHHGATATATVPWPGDHMASNAAAAVAVGVVCGMALVECAAGVENAVTAPGRVQWREAGGFRVLDDSYNANTSSMVAALETLVAAGVERPVAVLGAMAEIDDPVAAHAMVASRARELGVALIALETDLYGVPGRDLTAAIAQVHHEQPGAILVKGSRASRTERVIEALSRS